MEEIAQQYPHCRNLPIGSYTNVRPQILIGLKHASVGLVLKSKEGSLEQPIAVKTRLGWTICGGCDTSNTSNFVHYTFHACECSHQSDEDVHQMVKEYFSMDSLGIMKTSKDLLSTDDQRAVSLLRSLTKLKGNRYETGLLWRYDGVRLPDSKEMALRRHYGLEKRMQKDPELASALNEKMSDYLAKGYVRQLSDEELNKHYPKVWYLPIFPVFNPNKPGKIRIVWDGAAKVFGVSLNSALLTGPDQLCSLFAILLQFREYRVGVTGDIREMFHQIFMRLEDQQCLRFFWTDKTGKIQVYVMNVMSFGASCSPASAQYVKNINADRFAGEFPEAADVIKKRHYVDDAMFSTETPEHAIRLAQEVRQVHSAGGFEIRNWVSNSRQVLNALSESSTTEKNMDMSMGPMATEKVLGMWWCTTADEFVYKIGWNRYNPDLLTGRCRPTKRQMLQVLMTIFDPLGLISHFLMFLKILLQEVWRAGVQWDEEIGDSLYEKWARWLKVLPQVESVRIPRCLRSSMIPSDCKVQLHMFVDASENGIAAAMFLRFEHNGVVCCSLVAAKTRVAPLKFHSIPRLELQAALIGARLARSVTQTLQTTIHHEFFWTDSRDVLSWINSDHRRYSTYVAHRVSEILDVTEAEDWFWVPTKLNVADDGTKWDTQPDLTPESRWFRGPDFLYRSESDWPKVSSKSDPTDNELRPSFVAHLSLSDPMIIVSKFSSWKKLINVVAYVHRFVGNCRRRSTNKPAENGPLSRDELYAAEGFLFRLAQLEGYADEVAFFLNNRSDTPDRTLPKSSRLYKLTPWLDDRRVMRMRSRIAACQYATEETKNPVILPNDHPVTSLLIAHYHEKFHHQNHEAIVNELRQKYVIPRIRVKYAATRKGCQRCKNESSIPQPPIMADLPAERLAAFTRPFTHVGVDYFGPMEVVIGRRTEKRWGMIVTCLTTRAIHIELANSLSTSSCIIALRSFMGRRGTPRTIRSDRGTNFIGASRELKNLQEAVDYEQVMKEFVTTETSWTFNPPLAPHMGGSWERLIRSLKKNLMAICPSRKPSEEVLRSLLTEVESTLNSRPLTHVPIDNESSPALTPNHFLLGSSDGSKPFTSLDDSGALLKQNWRTSQALANQFWKRWLLDYLPDITRRTKWFVDSKPIDRGDVVIIVDSNLPRNSWPKGRVIATQPGKDGRIRSATVRTSTGIYDRPVAKLAVLDVRRGEEQADQTSGLPGGSVGHP
ncbi:uncharacterized protein LOC135703571 [Ochlerotatus camptorhynchus]|uniref:uncharacterized protein LOC135703571 n=1 Tax=Ochlerotatus camptorhynchus TaxID=644619 RepID=UPI0031CF2C9F